MTRVHVAMPHGPGAVNDFSKLGKAIPLSSMAP